MQPIDSLFKAIIRDHSCYNFKKSKAFYWSPTHCTIFYTHMQSPEDVWSLLHEVAHANLNHAHYNSDIELIRHETEAWQHARTALAKTYQLTIDDDYIQDHLDTYRQWIHARSTCPNCNQNGLQTQNTYRCINCRCSWRANEARICALRRFKLPK